MPISPRKTRSCSTPSSKSLAARQRPSAASRKATPSVRSASPASSSLRPQDLGAALRRQRPRLLADQLLRAAREQDVRRALGEGEQALLPLGVACGPCSSACARRRTAPRRRARSARRAPRPPARPCAPRRSARPRSDRPAPSSARRAPAARRCWRGRRRRARARARAAARRRSRRRRPAAPRPRARSPCRSKVTRPLAVTTARTVISFFVSVPVLSEAMTLAEPSVSTAARWRTIAFRLAMRCTPSDEHGGHHRRQAFRHRRDRERHAEDQHVEERREPAHVLDEEDRRDHHDGDDDDDDAEQLADAVELLLQRRGLLRRLLQQAGDAPHLGLHAGGRDHRPAAAVGRRRAAEDHVVAVAEAGLVRDRRRCPSPPAGSRR